MNAVKGPSSLYCVKTTFCTWQLWRHVLFLRYFHNVFLHRLKSADRRASIQECSQVLFRYGSTHLHCANSLYPGESILFYVILHLYYSFFVLWNVYDRLEIKSEGSLLLIKIISFEKENRCSIWNVCGKTCSLIASSCAIFDVSVFSRRCKWCFLYRVCYVLLL